MTVSDHRTIHSRLTIALGLLLAAGVGCADLENDASGAGGSGGSGSAGMGGETGAGGDAGSGGIPNETASLLMNVVAWATGSPLEGVRMCEIDTDNCAVSNADGKMTLDLPVNREVALTFDKEGYAPLLEADITDETFAGTGVETLYTDEEIRAIANDLGIDYPLQGGVVRLTRRPIGIEGVTFHPVGSSAEVIADDAFYYDSETRSYTWEKEATTGTLQGGSLPFAEGGFVEVPSGLHEFELRNAGGCIEPSWGWPGSAPNRVRLPVREGYIVYGSLKCSE